MSWPDFSSSLAYLSVGMAATEKAQAPMKAIPQLDLERFAGLWHEIARLPTAAQQASDRRITITFAPQPHAQLDITTHCEQADGTRRTTRVHARRRYPIEEPGQFQRRTGPAWLAALPWAWSEYWILALDRDYRWLMLGDPDRQGLWMLSRDPTMERGVLESLKSKARGLGYDLAPLLVSGELRSFQPL
jgi:apolipoprotein D and lipocalin family protein